ncbi:MAG: three-Cys-motif partner protein TcmP [Candidatus Kapabacteria bacterium]|nr:three-Cys-motif partner protein TcmP [Candidatus Kapabacteria bacterium]
MLNEPMNGDWGGSWTTRKLDAFAKYVSAYLKIMNNQRHWKTIYFDGFAGSGDRNITSTELYESLLFTQEEEAGYKGAAERVLTLPDNLAFDYYYFIDNNKVSLENLKQKISHYGEEKNIKLVFRKGECNANLDKLSRIMKDKPNVYASLIFLDPFGMQINWNSIENLKNTRSDIWILIPTGVIVNRLLDRNGTLKYLEKLQSFLGLNENEIKEHFYRGETAITLFGDEEIITKISKPIERIAELYIKRLRSIWEHVSDKPLVLKNTRGLPIYHFVFASNNQTAIKIANEIIKAI